MTGITALFHRGGRLEWTKESPVPDGFRDECEKGRYHTRKQKGRKFTARRFGPYCDQSAARICFEKPYWPDLIQTSTIIMSPSSMRSLRFVGSVKKGLHRMICPGFPLRYSCPKSSKD
jgi:hypothetical protein